MTDLDDILSGSSEKQFREKRMVAGASVAAAIFLTGAKLVVGFLTGSLGILAEAAHSGLDLAAALITLFAVRVSGRPADESHLYGHGKVENLSALVESLLLLAACACIIYEAMHRLFFKTVEVNPSLWAFLVMGMSIAIDFSRSRSLSRVAKKYQSQALEADALHFRTDLWSSAVVIIGLALVKAGEYRSADKAFFEHADAIAALMVAVIVIYAGVRLSLRAVDALLDRASKGLVDRLLRKVKDIPGILHVSRIRVRNVGNQLFVDLIVEVPRHFSFQESHQLAQRAQEAVHSISPNADVVVHTNPIAESETILEIIQAVAARECVLIHNVTTHRTERGIWIDLDLEVDPGLSFEGAHRQATDLEAKLHAELISVGAPAAIAIAGINAHIEPRPEESAVGIPLEPAEANSYIRRVNEISLELKLAGACHDIELHQISGKIYLSLHLLVGAGVPIGEVHSIAEQMESRLRREFPELGRVVIHTEPQKSKSVPG